MADARRAIFLDRDGVLNADAGYTYKIEDLRVLPGVPEALAALKARGFVLVVATNQSGVARGLYGQDDVSRFHDALDAEIRRLGGTAPDAYFVCPHLADGKVAEFTKDCPCRKPRPGLIFNAAAALSLRLEQSYMVGDRASDVGAAVAAGVKPVHIVAAGDEPDRRAIAHALSLLEALPFLI